MPIASIDNNKKLAGTDSLIKGPIDSLKLQEVIAIQPSSITINPTSQGAVSFSTDTVTLITTGNNYTLAERDKAYAAADSQRRQMDDATMNERKKPVENGLAGKMAAVEVTTAGTYSNNKVRGHIIDSSGSPVPFASVYDRKYKTGVQANDQGFFEMNMPDSIAELSVNAIGYNTTLQKFKADSTMRDLVLTQNNNALKEVVVTGAFNTKRAMKSQSSVTSVPVKIPQRITITNAIPVDGWENFNRYVNENLKTVEQLDPTAVSDEVVVNFKINESGKPYNVHAKKSLCASCREEAERIIKNIPPLKLNDNNKKITAVVRF